MNQDQMLAGIRDTLPQLWWAVYQGCLQVGFDERQSFALLQTFIMGQNPNGSKPCDGSGPRMEAA